MISIVKWMIWTPLQKLPNNVGDLGKIIVATCFECLPKVQNITQSGHTVWEVQKTHLHIRHPRGVDRLWATAPVSNHADPKTGPQAYRNSHWG